MPAKLAAQFDVVVAVVAVVVVAVGGGGGGQLIGAQRNATEAPQQAANKKWPPLVWHCKWHANWATIK